MKKIPEKLEIKQYKAKKGETIIHLLIIMANEMVEVKKQNNAIIDYLQSKEREMLIISNDPPKIEVRYREDDIQSSSGGEQE